MKVKPIVIAIICLHLAVISNTHGDVTTTGMANLKPNLKLLDLSAPDMENRFTPNSDGVTVSRSRDLTAPGIVVAIHPGSESFPGVSLKPDNGVWDLSQYGHFEARIVNTGTKTLNFGIRVDNANWKDSNCENYQIEPGTAVMAKVIFGFAYRQPGFPLKASEIRNVVFFANKSDVEQSFRIEMIQAAGSVGENWSVVRVEPQEGSILGDNVTIDPVSQIETAGGAQAVMIARDLKVRFSGLDQPQSVGLKPASGQVWDLRNTVEVRVRIKNIGPTTANPKVNVISNGGSTDEAKLVAPLNPGEDGEIIASFMPNTPWQGMSDPVRAGSDGQPDTGTKFTSDAVNAINISTDGKAGEQTFLVESIRADVPPRAQLPDWVGQRPPVAGDWTKTFDEEFSGDSVDSSKWNIYTENYWDPRCHFSKANVIVGGGMAKLRFERKTGYQNDTPAQKQTDYATGYLDTYGKWVQRYGYFEARMKLPKAPGLWPAFWLIPDRGVASGPQAIRCSTGNGGMEFDILEYLSRWGPYRYNIAMHWDYVYGQKVDHQTGSPCNYFVPDKDGFITAGLLWFPGQAIYYANGKEVLRWETPRISDVESYIIFTAISGGWDNDNLVDAKLPDDFVVDYVRVWQRKDLASLRDSSKLHVVEAAK